MSSAVDPISPADPSRAPRSSAPTLALSLALATVTGCPSGRSDEPVTAPTPAAEGSTPSTTPEEPRSGAPRAAEPAEVAALAASGQRFTQGLYGELRGGEGDLFFSPYSIRVALSMTYAGARGETAAGIEKALAFDLPGARVHAAQAALRESLLAAVSDDQRLAIANRLWGQRGDTSWLPEFIGETERSYGAGFAEVDFVGDTEGTRQTINRWIAEQTADKIPELLKQGVIDASTALVLTNAIYFKGQWAQRFDPAKTAPAPFQGIRGPVTLPMMRQRASFDYAEDRAVQVVELPYLGERLAMVVIVPRAVDGLASAEAALAKGGLAGWLAALAPAQVDLSLPRFRIEASQALNGPLSALGMAAAFSGEADFSGMNGQRNLFISKVIHSAFIEVDEAGSEAAAATAVVMTRSAMPQVHRVVADRPFLFAIRDRETGAVLFFGRLAAPTPA